MPFFNQQILNIFEPEPIKHRRLWVTAACFLLAASMLAWRFVESAVSNAEDELQDYFKAKAETLAWAIEGVARYAAAGKKREEFSALLLEIGRQPGVAWAAITSDTGLILFDNNPALVGLDLYTREEMRQLEPEAYLKGRFSPDEPEIYELWKRFYPQRYSGTGQKEHPPQTLFIGLDAAPGLKLIAAYKTRLQLTALAGICALTALVLIMAYWQSYRQSRKRTEMAMDLARQIIANYSDALLVVDCNGIIRLANKKSGQLFNLPENGASLTELGGFDWKSVLARLEKGETLNNLKGELVRPGKSPVPFELTATPIAAPGQRAGYFFSIRQLGEVARLRLKLAEARRMATLCNLASGLAHEIRNPLSSIRGYAAFLAARVDKDGIAKKSALLLVEETQRLNQVLDDLLHIARPRALVLAKTDLAEVILRSFTIIEPDARAKNISMHFYGEEKAKFQGDENALLQALLNILLNAIQFTPIGGKIKTSLSFLQPGKDEIPLEFAGQNVWQIKIEDTGPGIAPETQEEIFTPYYTTRSDGTGLGLSISRQIIMAHNGLIAVSGDQGAIFTILLPAGKYETKITDCGG